MQAKKFTKTRTKLIKREPMRSYGTTERIGENEQTTVSAQKNAIFSSQRFYGLEKLFRNTTARGQQIYVFITALLRANNKGRQGVTTIEKANYFRLKDKTKLANKQ